MTHIFAYHPKSNKSIKYSYSRIDVLPVFIAHAMSQVDELTFKHIHNPTTPDLYSSYAEKSEITRLLNQKRVSNISSPYPISPSIHMANTNINPVYSDVWNNA